jgi:hypothetical protein
VERNCAVVIRFNNLNKWVYVIGVTTSTGFASTGTGQTSPYFAFNDLVYGQGFATTGYTTALACDSFLTAASKPLDIIFVVDNSNSMAIHQAAVASLGSKIKTALDNAGLDWRIGLITTAYYDTNSNCVYSSCADDQ